MKRFLIMLSILMCIVLTSCDSGSLSDNMEEDISPAVNHLTPTEAEKPKEEAKEQVQPIEIEEESEQIVDVQMELILEKDEYTAEKLYQVSFDAITQPIAEEMTSFYSRMEENSIFSHSSRIPQELSRKIVEAMSLGKEKVDLLPHSNVEEMSQEEYCSLTGFTPEGFETVFPFIVDADNDGINDLIAQIYGGGTGGFSSMVLYRGSESGDYTLTSSFECLLQNFAFISYQEKNYLLMEEHNYNTKYFSGYTLYLYDEGILADGMIFSLDIMDYDMRVEYEMKNFIGMDQIRNTLNNKDLPELLDNNDGVLIGTAEIEGEAESYQYSSDIDNDDKTENYNKYMWYPSNMGTVMMCIYNFEESTVLDELLESLADEVGEGRLYSYWLDRIDGKNIMYLYYGENLDFALYAVLINRKP